MKALLPRLLKIRQSVPLSLRWQLAAWYTIAFALLLLLTGAVFYQYLESSLEASVDTDLQLRAQQVASSLAIEHGTVTLDAGTISLPGFGQTQASAEQSDVNRGALVRILDAHSNLLAETPAFQTLHVPATSVTQPLAGSAWQGTVLSTSDQEVRLYSRTLISGGKAVAVIQVGESLEPLHGLLHRLVAALLVVGFLVLLACAVGSSWLAARSLAPMKRLAETARTIKGGDLHQRVPIPVVRDEVHYLAVTLNDMLDSLEQAFSRQRRFVADASHELRTPVAVIRNKAEIALLRPRSSEDYGMILHSIHAETERLSRLINDLLALARGDEGQARFERDSVRLDHLVESVGANADGLAQQRGIVLTVQISHPVTVMGDEARLMQVLINLIDNALRYTNAGGQVQVSLSDSDTAACVVVRDAGIGIAPEHLPHIFERFYRADAARRQTEESHSGLGLSIVEWIVRMHGGSVVVESRVGQGSCFTVHLPKRPLLPPVFSQDHVLAQS